MNKTSKKILYGGFAVVALAGIIALLVSVFSPPKQIVEETETPTPPQTEQATTETASAEDEITPPGHNNFPPSGASGACSVGWNLFMLGLFMESFSGGSSV